MRSLAALALSFTLVGCGSQLGRHSPSGYTPNKDSDAIAGSCQIAQPTAEQAAKGYKSLNINDLSVLDAEKNSMSLCDFMKKNDLNVAVFQFAGVLCSSCQVEAQYFQGEFAKKTFDKAKHVVVLTDYLEDYSEEQFQGFMTKFSPDSLRTHDPRAALWKALSINPKEPTRPTVVAVDNKGIGLLINQEGAAVEPIMDAVEDLAIPSSEDQNPEEPAEEDDGLSPLELSDEQNFSISDAAGKAMKLADVFKAEYMIIDVSQFYCTYCKQIADAKQKDTEFQEMMAGTKCRFGIMLPTRDQSSWMGRYPASSFIGKTSFFTSSQGSIGPAFGVSISGIPHLFMIDRKGNVVDEQTGGMPAKVKTLCK